MSVDNEDLVAIAERPCRRRAGCITKAITMLAAAYSAAGGTASSVSLGSDHGTTAVASDLPDPIPETTLPNGVTIYSNLGNQSV
jgi:hypothetical protein